MNDWLKKERYEEMKKFIAIFLMVLLVLTASAALAEDLGIQVIGGPNTESIPMSLDDMQLGQEYTIDGYAKIEPVEYLVIDWFGQFNKDANYSSTETKYASYDSRVYYESKYYNSFYTDATWRESGTNAEFVWLKLDVTNIQKTSVPFMKEITVKAVYADEYEFAGWVRQINYDYNGICYRYGVDTRGGGTVVLNPDNEEAIDMMYTGTYVIGCTLPNSVFEDESSPLRIEISMGGNELTYNIRK